MNGVDPTALPLRDIHLPEPVSWWPLAPGWWFFGGALLVAAALAAWLWRRHRRARLPRAVGAELSAIETAYAADRDLHRAAGRLSVLARRVALARGLSDAVAATGRPWIDLIARDCGTQPPPAVAALLTEAAYSPPSAAALGDDVLADAVALIRHWAERPLPGEARHA